MAINTRKEVYESSKNSPVGSVDLLTTALDLPF